MKPKLRKGQALLDRFVSPVLSRLFWTTQLAQEEFPGIIGLEVTSICNLKCPMCPRTFSDRKFGHMPLPLFTRLVDEISRYDARGWVEQVALNEYGEIFLHPQWFEMCEYTAQKIKKAKIRLDSNATMMTDAVIDKLFESSLPSVILSVDGVDEESYNFLRKGGKFRDVVQNVCKFIERRKQDPDRGPEAQIQIIESDFTRPYLKKFKDFWEDKLRDVKRISVNVIPFHNFAGQIENKKFEAKPHDGWYVNLPCYRLTYEMDVFADGVTSVCCMDSERQIDIGNANQMSLAEIWHGSKLKNFRAEMRKARYGSLPLCRTCPHSQKFLDNYLSFHQLDRVAGWLVQGGRRFVRGRFFDPS